MTTDGDGLHPLISQIPYSVATRRSKWLHLFFFSSPLERKVICLLMLLRVVIVVVAVCCVSPSALATGKGQDVHTNAHTCPPLSSF